MRTADSPKTWSRAIAINLALLAAAWLLLLASVFVAHRVAPGWVLPSIAQVAIAIVGVFVATRFAAFLAHDLFVISAAYSFTLLIVHLWFGISTAQGLATHVAVWSSALLAVALLRSRALTRAS